MHKKKLIQALREFSENQGSDKHGSGWKGQRSFARYLIHYLEGLTIPLDEKYDFWRIEDYLPQILIDAWESFRTSSDPEAQICRKEWEVETQCKVPNITELGASPILDQSSAVKTSIAFMIVAVTGKQWLEAEVGQYAQAELHLLEQCFDKFLRMVYKQGMFQMIKDCPMRGMSGNFGETELRVYVLAGRTMFTFARKQGDEEVSFSFVSDDVDPNGLNSGVQSVYTDLFTCLNMIEDVIGNWPSNPEEQARVFKTDEEISLA